MRNYLLCILLLFVITDAKSQLTIDRDVLKRTAANNNTVPQTYHKFYRFIYVVSKSEMAAAGISQDRILKSLGLKYENLTRSAAGSFKIYLANTSSTTISANSWATAISTMTNVFANNVTLGSAAKHDFAFNISPFTYTGNNVYVALEFVNSDVPMPGGSAGSVANALSTDKAKHATSQTDATPIDALTEVGANYRPATHFGYGETEIKDVLIGSSITDLGSAPQSSYKSGRVAYIISASELANGGINESGLLQNIAFYYQRASQQATTGTLIVYLQNTIHASYQKGTTWATIITGMTKVRDGAVTFPAQNLTTFQFEGNGFAYTGGGVYVALEYVIDVPLVDDASTRSVVFSTNATLEGANPLVRTSSTSSATPNANLGTNAFRPYTTFKFVPSTLPVNLTAFIAKVETNKVKLDWTTSSEKDNDYFKVLHSANGTTFSDLATIKGKGTFSGKSNYSVYDNKPINGINYYKLLQYDLNGKATEIDVKTANFTITTAKAVSVYPNPVKNIINLKTNNYPDSKLTLTLSDLLGRTLLSRETKVSSTSDVYTFDLPSNVKPGQYILKITGNKSFVQAEKIIIE